MPSVAERMASDDTVRMMTSDDSDDRMAQVSRAAYLMVKGSIAEDLVTREELTEALQFAGFNPTKRTISRHWPDNTRGLTFDQFCQITEIEPIPSEKSLVMMFQKMDVKHLGYLTHEEFLLNMTTRGEKLPTEMIENLFKNEIYNDDKKFYYQKYCHDIIETSKKLEILAIEKVQQQDEEYQMNSKTYKVKRKTASPTKSASSLAQRSPTKSLTSSSSLRCDSDGVITPHVTTLGHSTQSRGSFYLEQDTIISHQFSLVVRAASTHRLSVHSLQQVRVSEGAALVDVEVYVFDENKRYLARTGSRGEWEGELGPGRYTLVPATSGARLRRRGSDSARQRPPLVERSPKIKLTKEFQNVLGEIFDQADLDGNGTLSRTEFNLFNWRTSGEEVSDEEWGVVVENFPLVSGELTREGFITLHTMEAEDNGGDETELRVTLQTMGYNSQLVQDESSSFLLSISSSQPTSLIVSALKSPGLLLEKTVTRCAMQADPAPTRVKGASNVLVYKEVSQSRVTFVIQNRSENNVNIQMDLSRSSGIITNRAGPVFVVSVPRRSSLVAAHVLPLSPGPGAAWNLEAEAKYIR